MCVCMDMDMDVVQHPPTYLHESRVALVFDNAKVSSHDHKIVDAATAEEVELGSPRHVAFTFVHRWLLHLH